MENPYEAPQSAPRPAIFSDGRRVQVVVSIVVAIFCVLQFWGLLFFVARALSDSMELPWSVVLIKLVRPAILFLSGILMVFQRKQAAFGFAAYVVSGLLFPPAEGLQGTMSSLLLVAAITAYCLHLYKAGKLR